MIILRSLLYNAVYFGGTALLAAYGAAFCRTSRPMAPPCSPASTNPPSTP